MVNYVNTASTATLSGSISSVDVTCAVTTYSGFPSASYWAIIARGTPGAEIVQVTNVAGATLTITRGQEGTVASAHGAGDTFEHVVPAGHFVATDSHVAATSAVHGVTGALVGTTDAQTLSNKTYRGAHTSTYSDATPAGVTSSYLSTADNSNARDGFVHKNTAGSATRTGFQLEQSGTPRFQVFNNGKVYLNPGGTPGLENDGTTQLDAAVTVNSTLNVTGTTTLAAVNPTSAAISGNATVGGTLGVTGTSTLGTVNSGTTGTGALTATTVHATGAATLDTTLAVTGTSTLATVNAGAISGTTVTGSGAVSGATMASTGVITAYGGRVIVSIAALASITSPATDQVAYLTTDGLFYKYNGSAWVQLVGPPRARLRQTVAQSLTNATFTALTFDAEDIDNFSAHSTSSNTSRYTCPIAGDYLVAGGASFASSNGFKATFVAKNGSVIAGSQLCSVSTAGTAWEMPARTIMVTCAASDYLEIHAYQETGGALNTSVAVAEVQPSMVVHYLGR